MSVMDVTAATPVWHREAKTRYAESSLFQACVLVLVAIIWHVRGFMEVEDSVTYFGHFNNSSNIVVPFYYGGYIALYTQILSYISAFLPFFIQPLIYSVGSLIVAVYFTYQLIVFLKNTLKMPFISIVLTALIIALVIKTTGTFNLFTNLTYSIWIGWLGLYLRVLNGLRGQPAGLLTIILGVLSAWSHSFCIVLIIPIIASMLLRPQRDARILIELVLYLAAACLFPLLFIEPGFPAPIDSSRLLKALFQMVFDVRSNMLVLIAVASLLALFTLPASIRSLGALFHRRKVSLDDFLLPVLAFVGLATVAIVLASGRVLIADKIFARYLYTPFLSLILVLCILGASKPFIRARLLECEMQSQRLLSHFGAARAAGLGLLAFLTISLVATWDTTASNVAKLIDGERFLIAAERYRATCTDGAFIHDWNKWSLTVLCHRRDLTTDSEAQPFNQDSVTAWGHDGHTATFDHERGVVPVLFQPAHVLRLPGL